METGSAPLGSRRDGDRTGTWFADERGIERRLKVTWHPERRFFVLSVWHGDRCTTTFRLPVGEVPRLVRALVEGLGSAAGRRRGGRADEAGLDETAAGAPTWRHRLRGLSHRRL